MRTFFVVERQEELNKFLVVVTTGNTCEWVVIDDGGVVVREGTSRSVEGAEVASKLLEDKEMIDTRCELKPEDREAYYAARVAHRIANTGLVKLRQKLNVPEVDG